ncbi:MAG: hypothetical protein PHD70_08495 [Anaerostipes sp.]|nr:hypothetical protein [Anaerostipes sp.]
MKKKLGIIMCICLMATISMFGGRRNVYAEEIDGKQNYFNWQNPLKKYTP